MKKKIAVISWMMSVALVFTCLGLSPKTAEADPGALAAQKIPLTRSNIDCQGNPVPPQLPQSFGFVVFNTTGNGRIIANIVLLAGEPLTTYTARVIQTPSGSDCAVFQGVFTTDAFGFGGVNIQEPLLAGSTGAFVALNKITDFTNFFSTVPAIF